MRVYNFNSILIPVVYHIINILINFYQYIYNMMLIRGVKFVNFFM